MLQLEESFWKVNPEVMGNRLKRFTVPMDEQNEFESAKMWRKVSEAIEKDDQVKFVFNCCKITKFNPDLTNQNYIT